MQRYKSGCVCEDGRESVRKSRSILRRIRGGREYGSGSGSVIRERRKRNGIWLKTISKRTIRLRSGIRFEINATLHSFKSFQQIIPSHRRHIPARPQKAPQIGPRFSTFNQPEVPTAKCRISKRDERGALSAKQNLFPAGRFSITSCGKKVTTRQRSSPFRPPFEILHLPGVPPA